MNITIKYGVSKTTRGTFTPVIFVGSQSSSYSMNTRKTVNGALKLVEKMVDELKKEKEHFGNTVELIKWEHSVI